jgi:hypothetical protein
MFAHLRESWRRFKSTERGHRFQMLYRDHQAREKSPWRRPLTIATGIAVIVGGVVALPFPGPGTLIIVLGLAILGRESARLSRWLDGTEVWLAPRVARLREKWRRLRGNPGSNRPA